MNNCSVLGVLGVGGERSKEGFRVREVAAEGGGVVVVAGEGLAAAGRAGVEEGGVEFGDDDVVGGVEVDGGVGAEGEGVELGLGEFGYVDVREGFWFGPSLGWWRWRLGGGGQRHHFLAVERERERD